MDSVIKECKIHGLCQHNVDKNGKIKCSKCSSDAVKIMKYHQQKKNWKNWN